MLNGISKHKFLDMSQPVRLRGKHTAQTAHCALDYNAVIPSLILHRHFRGGTSLGT